MQDYNAWRMKSGDIQKNQYLSPEYNFYSSKPKNHAYRMKNIDIINLVLTRST